MEFTNDRILLTTWLSALFEDYSMMVNSFVKSERWTYHDFEKIANILGLNYIHSCSVNKTKTERTEHHEIMSNLIMDAAKRYWLHFPWIPLRRDEKERQPQARPSTLAAASGSGYSENLKTQSEVDLGKVTKTRLKALVAGFYLVYYIYRTFPKLPSEHYEQVTIKVGKEDLVKMNMFKDEILPMLKELIGETGELVISTVLSLNVDLIFRRAYKPTVGGGSFGMNVYHQVYLNMVEARTMEFLIEDQDISEVADIEEKVYKVLERTTKFNSELRNLKSGCLKNSSTYKHWPPMRRDNERNDQESMETRNPDEMQLVAVGTGNSSRQNEPEPPVPLNPEVEFCLESLSNLCLLSKNRPMHMSNMAYGCGQSTTERGLISRTKTRKVKFVLKRKVKRLTRQRLQTTAKGTAKVWGFICGVPKDADSTRLALTSYENRIPTRGGFITSNRRQPLALPFRENIEDKTVSQPSSIDYRGGISARGRGRSRGANTRGRGQQRRGRGRVPFSAPPSREILDDLEFELPKTAEKGPSRVGSKPTQSEPLLRGRGRTSTQRSRQIMEKDQQHAVQSQSSATPDERGRHRRGKSTKAVVKLPSRGRGRGRGRRGDNVSKGTTTNRKVLDDEESEGSEELVLPILATEPPRTEPIPGGSRLLLRGRRSGRRGVHRVVPQS